MNKELEMTDKYIRYKLKREGRGVVNPRGFDKFEYKGEAIILQKNLNSNYYSLNIFKKGTHSNEGEYNMCQIALNKEEMKELYDTIGELLD